MKDSLRQLAWPILRRFEEAEGEYPYEPMHRTILFIVGGLFAILALVSGYFALAAGLPAGLLATAIFIAGSGLCLLVGSLGSERAVARLWRSR